MTKKKSAETKPATPEETATSGAASPDEAQGENLSPSLLGAPVVGLPKYDPHDRPVDKTQEPDPTPVRQSYEDIQAEAKGPGVAEWRQVDETRRQLTELYHSLREDDRWSEEHKSQSAWRRYEEVKARVEELAPTAREKMLKSVDNLERLSIPHPEGESLSTQDTDKLLLTAHERSRLEGMLNRAQSQAKGPFKRDPVDVLKAEYERGLSEGGPGGGAIVRAIYGLARDYGYDINKIVDSRRRESHRRCLEDAHKAWTRAQMVSRSVPKPPFPHPRELERTGVAKPRGQTGTYGKGARTVFDKPRRPMWK